MICSMALKMGLKGILILEIYDILLQIATMTVDRGYLADEQSTNDTDDTVLVVFWKNKNKNKKK
mgnify:FL=1